MALMSVASVVGDYEPLCLAWNECSIHSKLMGGGDDYWASDVLLDK